MVEKISHYITGTKQNDPRQVYLHISTPSNLQEESLWHDIMTSIKQYGKMKITNIMKNTYAAFFTIWNLSSAVTYKCGRVVLFLTSVYFAISQLILLFSYSFHIRCIILANVYFRNQKQVLLIKWAFFWSSKIWSYSQKTT